MRELTKSMTSFSWAMSVFGARQMLNLLNPSKAARAFESVTRSTEGQLDDTLRSVFDTGNRLQRSIVDATFGVMGLGGMLDPGSWTDATRRAMDCAGEAMGRGAAAASAGSGATAGPGGQETTGATKPGWGPVPG